MKKAVSDHLKSIILVPSILVLIFSAFSVVIFAFLILNMNLITHKNGAVVFLSTAFIAVVGLVPILTTPYKLIYDKQKFILKYLIFPDKFISRSAVKSMAGFWNVAGLSYYPVIGKNLHNNKKVIAFVKKRMKD